MTRQFDVVSQEEEREYSSRSEEDDDDDEDLLAEIGDLRHACMPTAVAADQSCLSSSSTKNSGLVDGVATASAVVGGGGESDCGSEDADMDDFLAVTAALREGPLRVLPLESFANDDDEEDDDAEDLETFMAIVRRFKDYESGALDYSANDTSHGLEPVQSSVTDSEVINSHSLYGKETEDSERFPDSEETANGCQLGNNVAKKLTSSNMLPESAKLFVEAIKKNRAYQKFLQDKLHCIEKKIEENKKMRDKVKLLKDFQIACRKITGRALSQRRDPHVLLISTKKPAKNDSKAGDTNPYVRHYGPEENSHVANYVSALAKFPLTLEENKWSEEERKNLEKGIKRQLQEMMLQVSVNNLSCLEGSSGDENCIDNVCISVKDHEITPEAIREFLPKVNWEALAFAYVKGHTAADCEARWLNCEDPLINHDEWTPEEDKKLLYIVQERGVTNWIDIAVSLGTNRTPFQCLVRYQRSLNASIIEREWTAEEDEQLRIAVDTFGESNWQAVASTLNKRTGSQCSNRWNKSLHPTIGKKGRWTSSELKRLKVAVTLFGPKNWNRIAQFVPGRSQAQCRERWVESMDPSLNFGAWSKEEDLLLDEAVAEHGYCWKKVAECIPNRTRKQCCRRWKTLNPDIVPVLQEARKRQKAALMTNFVDRACERPAFSLKDFIELPTIESVSEPNDGKPCGKSKRKTRGRAKSENGKDAESGIPTKRRSKKNRKEAPTCSREVSEVTDDGKDILPKYSCPTQRRSKRNRKETQTCPGEVLAITDNGNDTPTKKKNKRKHSVKVNCTEQAQGQTLSTGKLEMGTPEEHPNTTKPLMVYVRRKRKTDIRYDLLDKLSDVEAATREDNFTHFREDSLGTRSLHRGKPKEGPNKMKAVTSHRPERSNLEVDSNSDNIVLACLKGGSSKNFPASFSKSGNIARTHASILQCSSKISGSENMQNGTINRKEVAEVPVAAAGTGSDNMLLREHGCGRLENGDVPIACFQNIKSNRRNQTPRTVGPRVVIPETYSYPKSNNITGNASALSDPCLGGAAAEPECATASTRLEIKTDDNEMILARIRRKTKRQ